MLFNPRNQLEVYISNVMRFVHPYIAFITYRFHVEKSREIGKSTLPHILLFTRRTKKKANISFDL